jgi:hypothetical protein
MSDVPSLQDELNRKTFETVDRLFADLQNGRVTDAQYDYGIEILWNAVAGLVDRDFMDIAAEMRTLKKDETFLTKWYMRNAKGDTVVLANSHKGKVKMTVYPAGQVEPARVQVFDLTQESRSIPKAFDKFNELASKLEANGFHRI